MRYFSNFPQTLYLLTPASFRKPAEYVSMIDITRNFRFKKDVIDNIALYDYINIPDGESIEIVAEKLYGSPHYHWVLMLLNDRFDYIKDLPKSAIGVEKFIEQKYPSTYLMDTYGLTTRSLVVDFVDIAGISVDLNQTAKIYNISTGDYEFRDIISTQYHDDVIDIKIKRFYYKDTGALLDTKTHRVDYTALPGITTRSVYDTEMVLNDNKRKIRVISSGLLSTVIQNFKDLM